MNLNRRNGNQGHISWIIRELSRIIDKKEEGNDFMMM